MVKAKNNFNPTIAIPPGETLKENIEYLKMSQKELAVRTGISPKHINEIINGKAPITQETAIRFEYVLGIPASFWINLEANYQETIARIKDEEQLESEIEIAEEIPYLQMSKLNWVSSTSDKKEKVKNLRSYFEVSSLKQVPLVFSGAFRKADGESISSYALAAWLRRGELLARSRETNPFNKTKLRNFIPKFRELTLLDPEEFYPQMVNLCASCGIALVLVNHIPKTYVCGATQWIGTNKAVVQLSVRGARADIFWFTFFHEIAHIILHEKKENHIQQDKEECTSIEEEANDFARKSLIPQDEYSDFITNGGYLNKASIISFAKSIGVHPCIVIGRLQHDRIIGYHEYSNLKPSFKIVMV